MPLLCCMIRIRGESKPVPEDPKGDFVDEHRRTSIDLEARVLKCLRPMLHDPSLVEPGVPGRTKDQ